jgi:hypothetical protein
MLYSYDQSSVNSNRTSPSAQEQTDHISKFNRMAEEYTKGSIIFLQGKTGNYQKTDFLSGTTISFLFTRDFTHNFGH